jgi:hypothetical protein
VKCRRCRDREADSKEHIFQSAIGGRWQVAGILCVPCNGIFGAGIDSALTTGFQDLRVFLGIIGDRRQAATFERTDDRGNAVIVGPNMTPRSAERAPEIVSENGPQKVFSVASERAARQFLKSHERKGQQFTLGDVTVRTIYPGAIPMEFGFGGGEDGFRACIKTVLCLVAARECEGPQASLEEAWR